jgi:uncharacterized protein YndB with AHSA1/START domain
MIAAQHGSREVSLTRVIDAPRSLVWKAWTDPKHIAGWWGPKGFTSVVDEWDARPGGAIKLEMRAPAGGHPMTGTFHEVAPPERLVFLAVARDHGGNPLLESLTTVTFAEQGGKTLLTVQASAIGLVEIAPQMLAGMEMGWSQSLDRLIDMTSRERTST